MTTYCAPMAVSRGDVVLTTLGSKGIQSNEVALQRSSPGSHLSFGL
jgi:hypothetical protein